MLSRLDWRNNWSALWLAIFIGAVVFFLVTLLAFVWEFDVNTSPAWQVGVYYLMLALFLSLTFVFASQRPFPFAEWFRRAALALAVLVPAAVFAGGWVIGGAYVGFRDERTFYLVVVSVSSFLLIWITTAFPYAAFVLGKALVPVLAPGGAPRLGSGVGAFVIASQGPGTAIGGDSLRCGLVATLTRRT